MNTRHRDTGQQATLIAARVDRTPRRTISTVLVITVTEHAAEAEASPVDEPRPLRPLARALPIPALELTEAVEVAS